MVTSKNREIYCPFCSAGAVYRYGRIKTGKQRYLCMMCGRQFLPGVERLGIKNRPFCYECGRLMHLYKKENGFLRFRCSCYPQCKSYTKIKMKKEMINELLHA